MLPQGTHFPFAAEGLVLAVVRDIGVSMTPTHRGRSDGDRGRSCEPVMLARRGAARAGVLGRARADLQGPAEVVELIGQQAVQRGGELGVDQAVFTGPQCRGRHGVEREPVPD